jgi:two-component system, NtrC family, response regulator PilR
LHRALAMSSSPRIERDDLGLPESVLGDSAEADTVPAVLQGVVPPGAAGAPTAPLPGQPAAPTTLPALAPLPSDLAAYLDGVEREMLERALERHRYNRTAAGASLGLSLRQMRYRMARLGVGAADADSD